MKILVLGATGMLGNAVFRVLSEEDELQVFGTARRMDARRYFVSELASSLILVENLECYHQLEQLFAALSPQVIINCTALRKTKSSDLIKPNIV